MEGNHTLEYTNNHQSQLNPVSKNKYVIVNDYDAHNAIVRTSTSEQHSSHGQMSQIKTAWMTSHHTCSIVRNYFQVLPSIFVWLNQQLVVGVCNISLTVYRSTALQFTWRLCVRYIQSKTTKWKQILNKRKKRSYIICITYSHILAIIISQ